MSRWKKRGLRKELSRGLEKSEISRRKIERLRNSLKEVKGYRNKVLLTLRNLERWFAQGKVDYAVYQERKNKLSKLRGEYEVYLHKAKKEISYLEKELKKEKEINKRRKEKGKPNDLRIFYISLALLVFFLIVLFFKPEITGLVVITQANITLQTDKAIYQQYEKVNITGSGFTATGNVTLWIRDGFSNNAFYYPKIIQSDILGNISHVWNTSNACNDNYSVIVLDQATNLSANTSFQIITPVIRLINVTKAEMRRLVDYRFLKDVTGEIQTIDGKVQVDKKKLLRIEFNQNLTNESLVAVYLRSNKNDIVYVYEEQTTNILGQVNIIKSSENQYYWYNITLSNLMQPENIFDLWAGDAEIKYNYVGAYVKTICQPFPDTKAPSVTNIQPTPGSNLFSNQTATVSATVTDNVAVDTVLANITLPNASTEQLTLTDPDNNSIYEGNFTNTNLTGRYNVTIIANDTSGNINDSETTWFNITLFFTFKEVVEDALGNPVNVTIQFIDASTGEIVSNNTDSSHQTTIAPGMHHIMIIPPADHPILNLTFWNVNVVGNIDQVVDLDELPSKGIYLDPEVIYNDLYAIIPRLGMNYSHISVGAVANDEKLYKCRVFDFEERRCYGQWIKIRDDLIPNQTYSINLTPGDPAFGEGSDKLTLTSINIDGDMTDWDAVLDNPNNVMTDRVSGANDSDTVSRVDRDLTKFAFTWNESNLFFYFGRVSGSRFWWSQQTTSLFVYIDLDRDGYMNATDKVVKYAWERIWFGYRYDNYIYDYVPNATADILTGDGIDMPGSITNEISLEADINAGTFYGTELETRINWSTLNRSAGSPFKLHVSSAEGDTTDLPAQIEDNMDIVDTLLADVSISPDNSRGTKANASLLYNHTIKNLGNSFDIFDVTASSIYGWTVQLLWPNGTALSDTDSDTVPDTGGLSPDQAVNITVNITVPSVPTGTEDITTVTAVSSLDTYVSSSATDTTVVGELTITPRYQGRIVNNVTFTYNHAVQNNLATTVTADLSAVSNQGWTVQLLWPNGTALTDTDSSGVVDVGNVTAGSTKDFLLQITVPASATIGTIDETTITANSSANPADSGFVTDETTIAKRIEVEPDHVDEAGLGASIYYEHEVWNNWNASDVIDMSHVSNLGWGVELLESNKLTPLADTDNDTIPDTDSLAPAGGNTKIIAKITVPTAATEGDVDSTNITGTSSLDTNESDIAIDNTTAQTLILYNDSARTQKDYYFKLGETVYAKAFGLGFFVFSVYFVWIDDNGTIVRTSSDIFVSGGQAIDEYTTTVNDTHGNWTLILYNALWDSEITRRDFYVAPALEAPVLIYPPDGNITVDRTPTFVWNNSVGGVNVSYELMVDDNNNFASPEINVTGINETPNQTNYTSSIELEVDTTYYWKVRGNDNGTLSDWSSVFNFTVESYIAVSVIRDQVIFGMMENGEVNDTTDDSPPPFLVENSGNIFVNITVTGTQLFTQGGFPSDNFQFMIDENETSSYNISLSTTSWTNITNSSSVSDVADLDWHNIHDNFETELKVSVPIDEGPGTKNSTITFKAT